MTDTTIAEEKPPPTDPRPCDECGSTEHPTGHHENGADNQPTGHHENSATA